MLLRSFSFEKKSRDKDDGTYKGTITRALSFGKHRSRKQDASTASTPSTTEALAANPADAKNTRRQAALRVAAASRSGGSPQKPPILLSGAAFEREMQEYNIEVKPEMKPDSKIRIPIPGSKPGSFEKIVIHVPATAKVGHMISFELPSDWADERIRAREEGQSAEVAQMEVKHVHVNASEQARSAKWRRRSKEHMSEDESGSDEEGGVAQGRRGSGVQHDVVEALAASRRSSAGDREAAQMAWLAQHGMRSTSL